MSRRKKLKIENLFSVSPKSEFDWFNGYKECLNFFWSGNTRKAVDKIGSYLEKDHNSEGRFAFYRLWVECLSQDQDFSGLVALREHFLLRSIDSEYAADYTGLIGLIHLACDEFEAAELMFSSYDADLDSRYMDEFCHEFLFRVQNEKEVHIPFVSSKEPVWDYFHMRTLSSALLSTSYEDELKTFGTYAKKFYGNSPLLYATRIGQQVRKGAFGRAVNFAKDLSAEYPKNREFKGLQASLLALKGEKKDALRMVFSLLKKDTSSDELQLANWCMLDNAEEGLKNGKAAVKNFEDSLEIEHKTLSEDKKVWLTNIGDDLYGELCDSRGEDISFKYQLSEDASKGDWVVLARETAEEGFARIVGIFEVTEKLPVKIGITPNAVLDSIEVFEKSIEVSFHQDDRNETVDLYRSFGVNPIFNLDHAGLEAIFGEIEDQLIFDDGIAKNLQKRWSRVS